MLQEMPYPGGKNGAGVYHRLINLMPPHQVYIEPFLGGGAVMRLKLPARANIGVDLDARALSPFRAMSDRATSGDATRSAALAGTGGTSSRFLFHQGDGIDFLRRYRFAGAELVYADPPYVPSTLLSRCRYRFDLSERRHVELLRVLRRLPCAVMISGYWSDLYADTLRDWHASSFPAMTRGGLANEWLWCNFPAPLALHDYRYLGSNFRERERINRQKRRWVARLERMDTLQRRALLSALASIDGSGEGGHQ